MFYVIWKFKARNGFEQKMEEIYGSKGAWVQLFRRFGKLEYFGTDLLKDHQQPGIYITIDRWESPQAYEKFLKEAFHEYSALDKKCEALTENEIKIGEYVYLNAP